MRPFLQALALVLFTVAVVNAIIVLANPPHGLHASVGGVIDVSLLALVLGCVALYFGSRGRRV